MKDFGFYKTIRLLKNEKILKDILKLHNVYSGIPQTTGCLENISASENCCKAICCRIQTPQLLYSEFLLIWNHISKKWNDEEICDLFEKCMLNAIDELPSKGCVFFDDEKYICKVHKKRPLNCRIYGITPDEEFNPRYEKLKKEYDSISGAVILPQCSLVSTVDNKEVTTEDTNRWWNEIVEIEKSIGIPKKMVTDAMGGSYRSPHDHVLLYNMPENVLNSLSGIKIYKNEFDKKRMVKELIGVIKSVFKSKS